MCMSKPSTPTPPAPPPAPPEPPKDTNPEVKQARDDEKKRLQMMAGRSSTIATSARGLESQATTLKKKLGE